MITHCDCYDYRESCKHVIAVLYGIGHYLDMKPDLLFLLRGVDPQELTTQVCLASSGQSLNPSVQLVGDLSALFGIEIEK